MPINWVIKRTKELQGLESIQITTFHFIGPQLTVPMELINSPPLAHESMSLCAWERFLRENRPSNQKEKRESTNRVEGS